MGFLRVLLPCKRRWLVVLGLIWAGMVGGGWYVWQGLPRWCPIWVAENSPWLGPAVRGYRHCRANTGLASSVALVIERRFGLDGEMAVLAVMAEDVPDDAPYDHPLLVKLDEWFVNIAMEKFYNRSLWPSFYRDVLNHPSPGIRCVFYFRIDGEPLLCVHGDIFNDHQEEITLRAMEDAVSAPEYCARVARDLLFGGSFTCYAEYLLSDRDPKIIPALVCSINQVIEGGNWGMYAEVLGGLVDFADGYPDARQALIDYLAVAEKVYVEDVRDLCDEANLQSREVYVALAAAENRVGLAER